jgi:hypothetical protein
MEVAVVPVEAAGGRTGTWTCQGVLSQRVRGELGGASTWREFSSGGGAGQQASNAAALWVAFRAEQGGAYGGAPEMCVMAGGECIEEVHLR